jgi:glyceraldehyde 3-phosphate dehydrogenase
MGVVNVGINGFGRIGRNVYRALHKMAGTRQNRAIRIVAANDIANVGNLAYLLKYDSAHGILDAKVDYRDGAIVVNGQKITMFAEKNPADIPWGDHGVQIVIESTGLFRKFEHAAEHLKGGAGKVIVSAPFKTKEGEKDKGPTIVMGVNENTLKPEDAVVSNASCTTNCLAPVVKVLDESFGVTDGFMTTIHAATGGQKVVDMPNASDWRRGRAANENLIPTSTGAARAIGKVLPDLDGMIDGIAMRYNARTGSIVDLSAGLKKDVDVAEVNAAMEAAAAGELKGILGYSEEQIVAVDIVGNPLSSIFDSTMTMARGNRVKVFSWYDNEMGYSNRALDLALYMAGL